MYIYICILIYIYICIYCDTKQEEEVRIKNHSTPGLLRGLQALMQSQCINKVWDTLCHPAAPRLVPRRY